MINPIDKRYLDLVSKEAKVKALNAYRETVEIFDALNADNNKFFDLIDQGYPHNEYEEQEIEEFYFRDQIEAQLDRNHFALCTAIEEKCIASPEFMHKLAPYALFDYDKYAMFTGVYFSTTTHYDTALEYLEKIYENMQFRRNIDILIIECILNKNEEFFDKAFTLHQKYCSEKSDFERFISYTGKYYHHSFMSKERHAKDPVPEFNTSSWKKYYRYCIDKKLNRPNPHGWSEDDYIDSVFKELKQQYEHIPEVLDYIKADYHDVTGIDTLHYIDINIALRKQKDEMLLYQNNPHLKKEYYTDKIIMDAINSAASSIDASELIQELEFLNVDEKYYQSLKLKISLEDNLEENMLSKKPKKI